MTKVEQQFENSNNTSIQTPDLGTNVRDEIFAGFNDFATVKQAMSGTKPGDSSTTSGTPIPAETSPTDGGQTVPGQPGSAASDAGAGTTQQGQEGNGEDVQGSANPPSLDGKPVPAPERTNTPQQASQNGNTAESNVEGGTTVQNGNQTDSTTPAEPSSPGTDRIPGSPAPPNSDTTPAEPSSPGTDQTPGSPPNSDTPTPPAPGTGKTPDSPPPIPKTPAFDGNTTANPPSDSDNTNTPFQPGGGAPASTSPPPLDQLNTNPGPQAAPQEISFSNIFEETGATSRVAV